MEGDWAGCRKPASGSWLTFLSGRPLSADVDGKVQLTVLFQYTAGINRFYSKLGSAAVK